MAKATTVKTSSKTTTGKQNLSVQGEVFYQKGPFHILCIILLVYLAYASVGKFDFTNWDEKRYIFETPIIQHLSWANVKLMFSNKVLNSYNPLVLLSFAWDYKMAGNSAGFYHNHNLLLHLATTLIVYAFVWITFSKNKRWAFFTALLFGLHPLHTESVAWIASRKDVLYGFYFFSAFTVYMFAYLKNSKGLYILSLLLFVFSLFAKSQAVVLPLLIAVTIWYKEEVFSYKRLYNLIPFLVLSLVFGFVTIKGSSSSLTADEFGANFNFVQKVFLSCHAFVLYLFKAFVPIQQSAVYAFTTQSDNSLEIISYASVLGVAMFIGILVWALRTKHKLVVWGMLFFAISTFIVLHLIATNSSLIYERFTYVSYLGLFVPIAAMLENKFSSMFVWISLIIAVAGVLVTQNRIKIWKNSESLWSDVIEKQPTVSIAYNNRGNVYYQQALWDKALADFNKGIELNPGYPNAYSNRGSVYIYQGKFAESLEDNIKALAINPKFPEAWLGKGVALYNLGKLKEAVECYNRSMELMPNFPNAYNNRAGAYFKLKEYDNAIADFKKAIQLAGNNYDEARVNLALTYMDLKRFAEAEKELLEVKQDPRGTSTLSDLYLKQGLDLYNQNKPADAIAAYQKALNINPNNAEAYYNMGGTYLMQQNVEKAKECWRQVLKINPNHQEANRWLIQIGG